jgi:spore germination protein GerM
VRSRPDTHPLRRRGLLAGAVAVLAILVAACGIPVDHSPRVLDRRDMPAALTGGSTSTTQRASGALVSLHIYLVRNIGSDQGMQRVSVEVPEKNTIVSQAEAALNALIADQPSSRPSTANLTNAIPSSVRIRGVSLDGNVLELDLSHIDSAVVAGNQKLAIAQMVFTATDLTGINAVSFSNDGQPLQVPLDSAISKAGAPIRRDDYHQLTLSN